MKNLPEGFNHLQFLFDQPYLGVAIHQIIYPGDYQKASQKEKIQTIPSLLKGRKLQLTACNQAYINQSGYSEEALFNQDIYSLYTLLGAQEGFENANIQALYHHRHIVAFFQWKRPDKKPNWIKCIINPLNHQQNQYTLGICFDITSQVIAQDRLQQFYASQSKSIHDFRNPLAAIIGWARQIRYHPDELHSGLTHIERSSSRLLDLVEAGLTMNEVLSDQMQIKPEWIFLEDIEIMMDSLFALAVARKGLRWTCNFPVEWRLQIFADELRLTQILQNLVQNALQFTSKGEIKIHCLLDGPAPSKRIDFIVADTGIGIAKENHQKIFEPYEKLARSTDGEFSYGLGLTTTKELVARMEGSITLVSEPGVGSTFTVSLPKMEYRSLLPKTEEEKAIRAAEKNKIY